MIEYYTGDEISFSLKKKIDGVLANSSTYVVALVIGGIMAVKFKAGGTGEYLPIEIISATESKITIPQLATKAMAAGMYNLEILDNTEHKIGVAKNFLKLNESAIKSEIV